MEPAATDPPLLVVTEDGALLERLLALTATLGLAHRVVLAEAELRAAWPGAAGVLVGLDRAPAVAALVLPPRHRVVVVGADDELVQASIWSAPLDASVVTLPGGADALAAALGRHRLRGVGGGRLVALVGGSGGAGTSTCAAGLAAVAGREGLATALVDLDEHGGGLDLLLGLEAVEGWRWPRLAAARGFLGALGGQLPSADGVDLVAVARAPAPSPLGVEAVRAVLLSLLRDHALVVVDLPRAPTEAAREALRQADDVLVLVRADVRGAAAGRSLLAGLPDGGATGLLAREGPVRGVDAESLAAAVGGRLRGVLPHEPALAWAADRGDPPARSPRSALARSCRRLLDELGLPVAAGRAA